MDSVKLHQLFIQIAEGTDEERLKAAMNIINEGDDRTLQNEITNFVMTIRAAKDSVEESKINAALHLFFKKQMSFLFIQAFTYGQKYQHAISLAAIKKVVEEAKPETGQEDLEKK